MKYALKETCMLEANLRCSSLHLAFQQMLRAKKQSELIQCCGFGGDFREADPDPKRLQKIMGNSHKNRQKLQKYHIFSREIAFI